MSGDKYSSNAPRSLSWAQSVTRFGKLQRAIFDRVDFVFDGNKIRGLEQNPQTNSRWAKLARAGKKVMQFLNEGHYVANVVDGKVTMYGGRSVMQ
jgi:hypothetical protein